MMQKTFYIAVVFLFFFSECGTDSSKSELNKHNQHEMDGPAKGDTLEYLFKPVNQFVLSNVKTIKPIFDTIEIEIQVNGKITYDPRQANAVSSRVSGRIEKLFVKYKFQPIVKGQKLMEIYSPELLTEQQNYIHLLNADSENLPLLKAAESRLKLLGLSDKDLQKLVQSKKAPYTITVHSPYNGYLNEEEMKSSQMEEMNGANKNELSIKEGMYVQKGDRVFVIYDVQKVWAILDIRPEETVLLKPGQPVSLFTTDGEKLTEAKVDFTEPVIRENQFYSSIRIYLDNQEKKLKPGMIITAKIKAEAKKVLFIPVTAVVNLGKTTVVFKKGNEIFQSSQVHAGIRLNSKIEILDGINSSDTIAENAQLLIDSESFIKIPNEAVAEK